MNQKPTPVLRPTHQSTVRPLSRAEAARLLRRNRGLAQFTILAGLSARYQFGEQTLTVPRFPRAEDHEFWQRRSDARAQPAKVSA